jgi:SAM-dependent methyltransferase
MCARRSLLLWRYLVPFRLRYIRKVFGHSPFKLLDVGCGINSFEVIKHWLPAVRYYGLDNCRTEASEYYQAMDEFFLIDLEKDTLTTIPDGFFDVIILSHVIEHLDNGLAVIRELSAKLAPAGYIYIETPSIRTLALPSADGFLNFHDDSTHKRLYSIVDIANALLSSRVKIVKAARRRDPVGFFLLGPLALLYNIPYVLRHGRLYGRPLWDLLGVADFVLGQKRI